MLRHLGRGGLPHRVTVDGPRETASHCRGRLPKIISAPIADVFRNGKPEPILFRMLTRLRQLRSSLHRCAFLRLSVAEMPQTFWQHLVNLDGEHAPAQNESPPKAYHRRTVQCVANQNSAGR
jgi:hypothetical protein